MRTHVYKKTQKRKNTCCILIGLGLGMVVIAIAIFLAVYFTPREKNKKESENPNFCPDCVGKHCPSKILSGKGYEKECKRADHKEKCTVSCTNGTFGDSQEFVCTNGVWKGVNPTCGKFSAQDIQSRMEKFPGLPITNKSGSDCFMTTALNLLWNTPLRKRCKENATKPQMINNICRTFEQDANSRPDTAANIIKELQLYKWKDNDETDEKENLLKGPGLKVKGQGKIVIDLTITSGLSVTIVKTAGISSTATTKRYPISQDGKVEIDFADGNEFIIVPAKNVIINSIKFKGETYNDAYEILLKMLNGNDGDPHPYLGNIFDTTLIKLSDVQNVNFYNKRIEFGGTMKFLLTHTWIETNRDVLFIELPDRYRDNISPTIKIYDTEYILTGIGVHTGVHWISYLNDITTDNAEQAWIRIDDNHAELIGSFNDVVLNLAEKQSSIPNLSPGRPLMYQKK